MTRPRLGARLDRRTALLGLAAFACTAVPALAAAPERAAPSDLPKAGERDLCPVCGMFVAKYPYWTASVRFRDGHLEHCDGAKDLWKYVADVAHWTPGRSAETIAATAVTSYYENERIAAAEAWYVIGSNVLGPMGHELVPHAGEADAKEFLADHAGRRILRATEITPALLAGLDEGRFE
jgi:nitrous oxide reductase accessory protein NosL